MRRRKDGSRRVSYQYGPFGETLRMSGPAAEANPFRFSTKYFDAETGLYYYGYRYYSPELGRWPNRDPIGEKGGFNLFSSFNNSSIQYYDERGLTFKFLPPAVDSYQSSAKDIAAVEELLLSNDKALKKALEDFRMGLATPGLKSLVLCLDKPEFDILIQGRLGEEGLFHGRRQAWPFERPNDSTFLITVAAHDVDGDVVHTLVHELVHLLEELYSNDDYFLRSLCCWSKNGRRNEETIFVINAIRSYAASIGRPVQTGISDVVVATSDGATVPGIANALAKKLFGPYAYQQEADHD